MIISFFIVRKGTVLGVSFSESMACLLYPLLRDNAYW